MTFNELNGHKRLSIMSNQILRVMKLTMIIMTVFFLHTSAAVNAQKITLNKNDITINQTFSEIRKQTGYNIVWPPEKFNEDAIINVAFSDTSLEDALNHILKDQNANYAIKNKTIVIVAKKKGASIPVKTADTIKTVRGTVIDVAAIPLPGINVKLKGTTIGTFTDKNGNYSLQVPVNNGILIFSHIGFATQERSLGNELINVQLVAEYRDLNEVVVVGYGSQKRTTITGSIASVPMDQLKDMPVANIATALQGKITGVIVQQSSGSPGSNPAIKVRGIGSISAKTEPLIVLDGNIVDTYVFSLLNSNEIDRIDVLKDASSAAIYGSKGANGVILVTTKKGKVGKTSIDADVYTGFQQVEKKLTLLNSQQFAELAKEAANTAYLDNVTGASATDLNSERPSSYLRYRYPRGDLYDWFDFDDAAKVASLPTNDYQDLIFRNAMMSNYQLTSSGGTERSQFLITGGYLNQDGIINNSSLDRYSVRSKLDINVSSRLKIGLGLNPSYKKQNEVRADGHWSNNGIINSALSAIPMAPIYSEDGTQYSSQAALAAPYNWPGITNPIANITEYHSKYTTTNLLANAYGEYAFLDNLHYRLSGNVNFNGNRRNAFRTSKMPLNQLLPPTTATGNAYSNQGISLLFNQTLTYNKTLSEVHDLNFLAGMEATKFSIESSDANGSSYANDLVETLNGSASGSTTTATSSKSENASISYFARAGYSYKSKYLVNMSVRWDGSSIFGTENRWGTFPAASIGWKLTEEPFMKSLPVLSDAKIRVSYGLSGNNSFPNNNYYPYLATLRIDNYSFNNILVNGLAPASLANLLLGWEKSKQFDVGLEMGLFNDRVSLVIDYYKRITHDLLLSVNVPSLTGFRSAFKNVGKMENKGWEFGLTTHNLTGGLVWNTSMNASVNKNKVIALGPTGDPILSGSGVGETNITRIGEPIGNFYGYKQLGIFQNQAELDSYPHDPTARPGDAKYEDVNNDGKITAADRTIIGNNQPDFIYSINNSLGYKNFDLSIAFQGTHGGDVLNLSRRFFENFEGNANQLATVLNRWHSESDPGDGQTPRANARTTGNNGAVSSRMVEDGSFLRLQNVSIGYQLPESLLQRLKVAKARVYLSGQNLHTWSNYLNYNPEVSNYENALTGGVDFGSYPLARTFIFGLSVGF